MIDADEKIFWLSFCDPDKPKSQKFLGVVIIEAPDFHQALQKAWELNLNPGGEVQGGEVNASLPIIKNLNKLLSKQDLIDEDLID